MEQLMDFVLYIHIGVGTIALTSGIIPMIAQKGGKVHNTGGLVYFWAMFAVFITATPISIYKTSIFLFTIGIFSFYLAFTGYRHTKLKPNSKVLPIDRVVTWLTVVTGIAMLGIAGYAILFSNTTMGIILGIFGGICTLLSISDVRRYKQHPTGAKSAWFFGHLTRMIASYIAATTAFLTNVAHALPDLVAWLAPTVIGSIAITYTVNRYQKKMGIK